MRETKTLVGVDVPAESEGKARIRFATYNEKDHHGDVTLKGAFKDGQEVVISAYNHSSWGESLPVGKGRIVDSEEGAHAELQFFMNTTVGRETFETVKAMDKLQQWSYGFDIEDSSPGDHQGEKVRFLKSMDVHEVSPVLLGAGKSTATLDVKQKNGNMRMADQAAEAVASIKALADRAEEIVALRKSEGKTGLATETQELIELAIDQLDRLKALATTEVEETEASDDAGETVVWEQEVDLPDEFIAALVAQTRLNLSEEN